MKKQSTKVSTEFAWMCLSSTVVSKVGFWPERIMEGKGISLSSSFFLWMSKENLWKPQCRQRYFPKGWHSGRRYDSLLLHTNSAHRSTVFRKIKFKLGNIDFYFSQHTFYQKSALWPKIILCILSSSAVPSVYALCSFPTPKFQHHNVLSQWSFSPH